MKFLLQTKAELLVASLVGFLHCFVVRLTYNELSEPYMDEEFHINQTRTYCSGNFSTWNSKITTPPALYLLAVPYFCGRERYLNSILISLCYLGLCKIRRKWLPMSSSYENWLTPLIIVCLPVLLDTSFLFYTDMLSLTTVIWGFSLSNTTFSALVFAVGVLTRQTNIVWAGMYCLLAWLKAFDRTRPISSSLRSVMKHTPFVILAAGFVSFVYWNQGIVLGDRSAHQPLPHLVQFFYFLAFSTVSSIPIFLSKAMQRNGFVHQISRRPSVCVLLLALILLSIKYFTFVHPYILADNRHFTFYLWRKFFARHNLLKFSVAPIYLVSLFYIVNSMSVPKPFIAILLVCTCTCIIPAHLLEFRYFIVPYALWRLTVSERNKTVVMLELVFSLCINFLAMYLFLKRPFQWPHQPATLQRFMW